jgi:hypothetical protein
MRWNQLWQSTNRAHPPLTLQECLRGFRSQPGVSEGTLQQLAQSLRAPLPAGYCDFLRYSNGGEGFIGRNAYLRFYTAEKLREINGAYEIEEYLPGFLLIASNTIGDAICFRAPFTEGQVVQVPFIPLWLDYAEPGESGFGDFLASLAVSGGAGMPPSIADINPAMIGKEIFQRHPIALGGSPTDASNRCLVPLEEHTKLVRHWNGVFRQHAGIQVSN